MTEAEFATHSERVVKRINYLKEPTASLGRPLGARRVSQRKFRLFAVACCRRDLVVITNPDCRRLIDLSEQLADGEVAAERVAELRREVGLWAGQHVLVPS